MDWTSLIGPAVVAAVISGLVSTIGIVISTRATRAIHAEKLSADADLASADRAWADYERRSGAYTDVIRLIDSLFEGGDPSDRREYLRAVRKVWLIGSDDVVRAINRLSLATGSGAAPDEREQAYRDCIHLMRVDLRIPRSRPPTETKLEPRDFRVEGAG